MRIEGKPRHAPMMLHEQGVSRLHHAIGFLVADVEHDLVVKDYDSGRLAEFDCLGRVAGHWLRRVKCVDVDEVEGPWVEARHLFVAVALTDDQVQVRELFPHAVFIELAVGLSTDFSQLGLFVLAPDCPVVALSR